MLFKEQSTENLIHYGPCFSIVHRFILKNRGIKSFECTAWSGFISSTNVKDAGCSMAITVIRYRDGEDNPIHCFRFLCSQKTH